MPNSSTDVINPPMKFLSDRKAVSSGNVADDSSTPLNDTARETNGHLSMRASTSISNVLNGSADLQGITPSTDAGDQQAMSPFVIIYY